MTSKDTSTDIGAMTDDSKAAWAREQIEQARREIAEWPEWFKRVAYMEGEPRSTLPPTSKAE